MGDEALTLTPSLIADWRGEGGASVAVNLGYKSRDKVTIDGAS